MPGLRLLFLFLPFPVTIFSSSGSDQQTEIEPDQRDIDGLIDVLYGKGISLEFKEAPHGILISFLKDDLSHTAWGHRDRSDLFALKHRQTDLCLEVLFDVKHLAKVVP